MARAQPRVPFFMRYLGQNRRKSIKYSAKQPRPTWAIARNCLHLVRSQISNWALAVAKVHRNNWDACRARSVDIEKARLSRRCMMARSSIFARPSPHCDAEFPDQVFQFRRCPVRRLERTGRRDSWCFSRLVERCSSLFVHTANSIAMIRKRSSASVTPGKRLRSFS